MIIRIKAEELRDPFDSERILIREEDAAHCDGGPCGEALFDQEGELLREPGPHHHIVASGENPTASPHYGAVFSR